MLLTLSTRFGTASDLGYLLHKHPDRVQRFDLSFGSAVVFFSEATEHACTACLLLDVDPIAMVRKRNREQSFLNDHYVNDRPYVASSFMSVAISHVFRTAMSGRCKDRPKLAEQEIPLTATLDVLPVRGDEQFIHRLFSPLGYDVQMRRHPLDEAFPEWGDSRYYSVSIAGTSRLSQLLTHLYVLIPVFDNSKHYFVGDDEVEKLVSKGDGWLESHPEKDQIAKRYLRHQGSLYREALARLAEIGPDKDHREAEEEAKLEKPLSLNEQRLEAVMAELRASGARKVLDLGCGEGKLLRELRKEKQFTNIVGVDVSVRSLELASRRLKLERTTEREPGRLKLVHGSLVYRDARLTGFDAAAVVEVIEHLDPSRLASFERALFECARPKTIVLSTPNREYNMMWDSLPAGAMRHADHRFEWTRTEFQNWATNVASRHSYCVRFLSVGPEHEAHGSPTQLAVFDQS